MGGMPLTRGGAAAAGLGGGGGSGRLGVSLPALTADDWNNIAWNLPAGQALRAKIEALVCKLKPEQEMLREKVAKRDSVRRAHDASVAVVEEAQAALARLQARQSEMDVVLGEVRQQLEEIKKALLKLTKADLDQLRRMPDPPVPIRRTLEMVCSALWRACSRRRPLALIAARMCARGSSRR